MGKTAIADAIAIDRKDYALLFATDQYDHWTDLVNPIDDANSIAQVLKSKYRFQTEVIENPSRMKYLSSYRNMPSGNSSRRIS